MKNRSTQQQLPAPDGADWHRWYPPIGLALVLLATYAAYRPALHGGPLWDDDAHLTRPELQSLGGLYRIWFTIGATYQYYPLLHSAFWLEHALWGDSMLGYHVINLLWHLLAVVLVYLNLTRLKVPGALFAAAIFALHPVMVESVAWVTEQKNTLSTVFYLSAMLIYLKFDESRSRTHYTLAIGFFILGLLTKTVTASLPAALLVIFWWQRSTLEWRRDVWPLVPFFVLGASAGLATAWFERKLIGAEGADFELTLLQRGLLAGRVIWFYLAKLLWPANLTFIYPRWTIDSAQAWQWIFSIAAVGVTVVLLALHKRVRGPLAGWLFFCGTLFPVLGFLNVYPFLFSFVADHFQYLASLGIIVVVAAGVALILQHLRQPARNVGAALTVMLVAVLATLTWRQSHMYANGIALYRATLERNPDCWLAHNNLGLQLAEFGDRDAAIEHFRRVIRIKPDYATAHNNLGLELVKAGKLPEAIAEYREALRLRPNYFVAHHNLGVALEQSGQLPQAVAEFQAALALKDDDLGTINSLGMTLARMGCFQEAAAQFRRVVELYPNLAGGYNNLGMALADSGEVPQAIEQFRLALARDPNEVATHKNLGRYLVATGDLGPAIEHLEFAVRVQPNAADAHHNLGDALAKVGRTQEAIGEQYAAVRLAPNFFPAYASLASALASNNRSREAIATARKAIEVARATGLVDEAKNMEEWIARYQDELQRDVESASQSSSSPPDQ